MPTTSDLLDLAATHLAAAAAVADDHDAPDPAWAALAGQIRLTAAGLPTIPSVALPAQAGGTLEQHLGLAIDALDHIDPLDGPADLPLWAWHLAELTRLAQKLPAA